MQLDPSVEKEHLFSNFSESVRTVAPGPITEPMGGGGEGTHAATPGHLESGRATQRLRIGRGVLQWEIRVRDGDAVPVGRTH